MRVKSIQLKERNGRYILQFRFADGTSKSTTLRDSRIANAKYRQAQAEKDAGTLNVRNYIERTAQNITIGQLVSRYVKYREELMKQGGSKSSYMVARDTARVFFSFNNPDLPAADFTANHIRQWLDYLRGKNTKYRRPYKANSVMTYKLAMQSAFSWARAAELIESNPFAGFEYGPLKNVTRHDKPRYLTDEEVEMYRKVLDGWHLELFNFALWTGLRNGELISLNRGDIVRRDDKLWLRVTGKGRRQRFVPLNKPAHKIIEKRLKQLDDPQETLKDAQQNRIYHTHAETRVERVEQGYIFWEASRTESVSAFFRQATERIFRKADDTRISFHSTRHTFATNYLTKGGDIETLQELLGHSSIKTTQIYAKITSKKVLKDFDLRTAI